MQPASDLLQAKLISGAAILTASDREGTEKIKQFFSAIDVPYLETDLKKKKRCTYSLFWL